MSHCRELETLLPFWHAPNPVSVAITEGREKLAGLRASKKRAPRFYFLGQKKKSSVLLNLKIHKILQLIFAVKYFSFLLDINNSYHARTEVWAFLFLVFLQEGYSTALCENPGDFTSSV